jgi:hypothetical protein
VKILFFNGCKLAEPESNACRTALIFLVGDISVSPLRFRNPLEVVERLEAATAATAHLLIGVAWLLALAAK